MGLNSNDESIFITQEPSQNCSADNNDEVSVDLEGVMNSVRSNTRNEHSSVIPSAAMQLKHRLHPHEGI